MHTHQFAVQPAVPAAPPPAFPVSVVPPQPGVALAQALQPPSADYAPPGYQPRGFQDAPGVPEFRPDYYRYSDPVPEYIYDPDYYDDPWQEVHQIADYAPPGYETRDYQSAPGDPEFTRITPPVRVSQEEREKFVVGGIVPGSFLVPGTNTSFRLARLRPACRAVRLRSDRAPGRVRPQHDSRAAGRWARTST